MKRIFITVSILFFTAMSAFATTLPQELTAYIKKEVPTATIRFDGLITFQDKTTYLPLIPPMDAKVEKLDILYTHPVKSDLKKKADIIIFNNNYVLLRVIKEKHGSTFAKLQDYPITVKTGMLPQDLVVPKGLYVPESLEGILGDLKVPVGQRAEVATKKDDSVMDESTQFLDKKIPVTVPKIEALKNKLYFISNYDSNYLRVINSNDTQPLYSLKLESIPRSIVATDDGKYLLITTGGKTYVDIVDIQREEIAKQVDLTVEPDEVVIDNQNRLAYVAAKEENALFIIDINTMELKQKIILKGTPINLSVTEDGNKLVYQDKKTTKLYVLYINKEYLIVPMINISNISKLIATKDIVYAISRTQNILYVLGYPSQKKILEDSFGSPVVVRTLWNPATNDLPAPVENLILAKTNVSSKPVDMILYNNKLYILGANHNQLDIYDKATNKIETTIDLPMNGFSKKIIRVDKTNYVVIANAFEEKYLIFDMDKRSTVQQVPVNTKINNMLIIKKIVPQSTTAKKDKK